MARTPAKKSKPQANQVFDADEGDEGAGTSAPSPPPVEEKPQHNPKALAMARSAGLSEAEANEMTPQELGAYLMADYNRLKRELEARQQQPTQTQQRQPEPEPVDPRWAWLDAKVKGEDGVEAPMYDQNLVSSFKAVLEENKSLKGGIKEIKEQLTKREQSEYFAAVDDAFDSLGEKYHRLIGPLTSAETTPGSKEAKFRIGVWSAAGLQPTDSPTIIKRKIRATAREMLGEFVEANPPKTKVPQRDDEEEVVLPVNRLNGRARDEKGRLLPGEADWLFGSTGRPTSRATPEFEGTDEEQATAAIAALQKQVTGQDFTRSSEMDRATLEGFLDG